MVGLHTKEPAMSSLIALLIPSALAGLTLSNPVPLPGDAAIGPAAGDQSNAVLVEGDGQWLLVWEDTRSWQAGTVEGALPLYVTDLWGTRLDETGAPIDAVPFRIARSPWQESRPRVAFSGGEWLVAYDALAPTA